jgi:uncharacterized membrane protein
MNKEKDKLPSQSPTKEKSITTKESITISQAFEGPIPHSRELAEYEKALPGSADRIITMAESEAKHRHGMEEEALKAQIWEIRLGQIFGFFIGIFAITAGAYCAINGSQTAGSIIGGGGVVGLVSAFIIGRKNG